MDKTCNAVQDCRFTSAGWAKQNRDFFSYVKCCFDRKIVPLFCNINRKHTHFPHYFLFEPSLIWRALHQFNQNTAVKPTIDRKSTRLNSSHVSISYAVFCLKKKKK